MLTGTVEVTSSTETKSENIVVYLEEISGSHEAPEQVAVMDQKDEEFVPHLLSVQTGQTVAFTNGDLFTHNVHLFRGRRSLFNIAQGIRGHNEWTAQRAGEYLVLCDIHRKMSAFILVHDHPFFARAEPQDSAAALQFKIAGVPEGTYTLVAARDLGDRGMLERQRQEVTITADQTTTVTVEF